MIKLNDAVIPKPSFVKLADFELSHDVSDWNEEILKNFYEQVSYLPREIGVNVVIKNVDENKGYAKGSIVVFFNGKQINFPIIVRDYKLSPFDVFVYKEKDKDVYYPASEDGVKKVLMSDQLATLENRWDQTRGFQLLKTPGGVMPKQPISLYDAPEESIYPPFAKMSGWRQYAHKEDLEKLAETLIVHPDVGAAFHDNTGDLVSGIVQLKRYQREEKVPKTQQRGVIDLNGVIKAKRTLTALDSDMLDTSKLIPLLPPCVAELRLYEYPSMEDFLSSGDSASERFIASKIGKPVVGIILDLVDQDRYENGPLCAETSRTSDSNEIQKAKEIRNKRDQIFFSMDGRCYSIFNDYGKTGIGFYGTNALNMPKAIEKTMKIFSIATTDDFINVNPNNQNDGSDKLFAGFNTMEQGKDRFDGGKYLENSCYSGNYGKGLFVIYGAGDAYECVKLEGNFRKYTVQQSHVYVSKDVVVIPANIASVQKVSSVKDPMYKMIVGKAEHIYLIPESSLIVNKGFMKSIGQDAFMRPDLSVQKTYEEANITKVALSVVSDGQSVGYRIDGKPFEPLKKIAHIGNTPLNTMETKAALRILGMDKTASDRAMSIAIERFSDSSNLSKSVFIYGVDGDYVNPHIFDSMEKVARVKEIIKGIAKDLRVDLVKEASILTDPNSADVVLSLNFINDESLGGYIDNIPEMKKVLSDLSGLLIASRMGLSDIDETAVKNSMKGLDEVITGLQNVKMAVR